MALRGRGRVLTRHADKAAWMRDHRFEWLEIATYPAAYSANCATHGIRGGAPTNRIARHYGPAGAFETRTETTDQGTTVHARYIGGPIA